MKIYNTLTAKKEEFIPRNKGRVSIYICGPTVYNYIHIGNARAYVAFDAIIRYLQHKGFDIKYVRNLTDVDDKIIKKAAEEKTTTDVITAKYTEAFHKDMQVLGVQTPTIEPKATENIQEMIDTISQLINKGLAYQIDGDVYFSVEKFPEYGKLSKRTIEEMLAGARIEVDERKKNPADFALWKMAKEDEPSWPSPWGNGRPGWHIECSTMSIKYLGMGFDVHGGGQDLIFPHHENEIAQAEGATGQKPFTRYWMHNGFLNVEAEKMAKSIGNVILVKDLKEQYKGKLNVFRNHLRMLFLSTHYRSPLNFTDLKLEEAAAAVSRVEETLDRLQFTLEKAKANEKAQSIDIAKTAKQTELDFAKAMDDDFNTPLGLATIFNLIKEANLLLDKKSDFNSNGINQLKLIQNTLSSLIDILGFALEFKAGEIKPPPNIEKLIKERDEAREEKDFAKADEIRAEIEKAGFIIEDTPYGAKVKKSGVESR